jgi:hypothetical protein
MAGESNNISPLKVADSSPVVADPTVFRSSAQRHKVKMGVWALKPIFRSIMALQSMIIRTSLSSASLGGYSIGSLRMTFVLHITDVGLILITHVGLDIC